MLYDVTNGRWKLPVRSGCIKRPCGSIIFTLNLVKPTLQIGNQLGSLFVTMSQINKFHSHKFSYKNSYHKEIQNLLKPPSHNPNKCKQNPSEIRYTTMSWDIWCWYVYDYKKLTNQNTYSHRKHSSDFQQAIGIEVPTQGIHGHSCDLGFTTGYLQVRFLHTAP